MIRVFDITLKDTVQLLRDRKTFLFLLIMPIAFTLLFGYAGGGFGEGSDPRFPVGYLDQDDSSTSRLLRELLAESEVIRLVESPLFDQAQLEAQVVNEDLAAVLIVPRDYGRAILHGKRAKLLLIGDTGSTGGISIESDVLSSAIRLESALHIALAFESQENGGKQPFDYIVEEGLKRWDDPPIGVKETTSSLIQQTDERMASLAHTSPGMMLQFAIAGLLTCAQILVVERKSRCLQRLLTTATFRWQILLGHFIAILILIFTQFLILILFGQLVLKVDYLRDIPATLLVAFAAAVCIAAMGLLIGTLAQTDEQAVIFSIVPMFLLAALGGAWVPLEVAGGTFQTIGHLSPIAWAMDGFKNISIRGLGIESVLLPAGVLFLYAGLLFGLATWRFRLE